LTPGEQFLENDTLTCPYCGAPHRDKIPQGTIQVKCKYCGGNIMVPTFFGGVIQRCTNHSEILAVGLCNDCGQSYCDNCLSRQKVEDGTLFLCPTCRSKREDRKTISLLSMGLFVFIMGMFFAFAVPVPQNIVIGAFLFVFLASPFLIWGIYRMFTPPHVDTLKAIRERGKQQEEEPMTITIEKAPPSLVYDRLLNKYLRIYDPKVAYDALERRIQLYRLSGMSRSEAVRKIAEEEGLAAI
jgi:hypothetical protein